MPKLPLERLDERGDRPVAAAAELLRLALDRDLRDDPVLLGAPVRRDELVGPGVGQVVLVEGREELVGGHLVAARVGDRLHLLGEVDLQPARQLEVVLGLHQVGDAALARLRVDADDRLVGPADVHRVDRQVGDVPELRLRALLRVHALLDRVLVRARERRVDELAGVGVARVHGQLVALLDDRACASSIRERSSPGSTPWVSRFSASVTRSTLPVRSPLPKSVPSTRSAPAIRPSSAVATAVPRSLWGWTLRTIRSRARDVPLEPLEPVGVDVRRERLDRRRQVDDHLLLARRPPLGDHRLADLERVVELGAVEALGRVLEDDLGRSSPPRAPCRAPSRAPRGR